MSGFHAEGNFKPKDFWSLVDLFSNLDKTKGYLNEIKDKAEALGRVQADINAKIKKIGELEEQRKQDVKLLDISKADLANTVAAWDADIKARYNNLDREKDELAQSVEANRVEADRLASWAKALSELDIQQSRIKSELDTQALVQGAELKQRLAAVEAAERGLAEKVAKAKETLAGF